MRHKVLRIFAIVSAIEASSRGSIEAETARETAALAVDRAIDAAILNADAEFLERTLDATFRFTHGDGKTQTKKELIDAVRAGRMRARVREVDEQDVELHGEIVIVNGRVHVVRDVPDPARRDYSIWYVRVYTNQRQGLVLLSHRTVRTTLPP